MPNDSGQALQKARDGVIDALLEKVREDMFPSTTVLDQVEALLEPEDLPEYVEVLREKIARDSYPSITLVRRIVRLTRGLILATGGPPRLFTKGSDPPGRLAACARPLSARLLPNWATQ